MNSRHITMLLLLLGAALVTQFITRASERDAVPARKVLRALPDQLGAWRLTDTQTLDEGTLRELAADDTVSRTYVNERGPTAFLFIAFYANQRHRKTYHSPQNCLPGAGWTISAQQTQPLGDGQANQAVIEKDGAQMLSFYWYHGRGRIVANEYLGRWQTVQDSLTRGRTDGALVRVVIPFGGAQTEAQAQQDARQFAELLLPLLTEYVPN